jgi:hypothetical protein
LFLVNYVRNRDTQPAVVSNTANTQSSPEQTAPETPQQPAGTPTLETSKIDLRVTDSVYLSSAVDGKSSETQIEPSQTTEFAPKDNLRLKYHISRANMISMQINGKPIDLPKEPANPKRSTIELEINKNNFAQIWQSGRYVAPEGAAAANPVSTPRPAGTPRPTASVRPSPSPGRPASSPSTRPAAPAVRPTPR